VVREAFVFEFQREPSSSNLRIDSVLLLVPVSVRDRMNRPVLGLERATFAFSKTKMERPILFFAVEDDPEGLAEIDHHTQHYDRHDDASGNDFAPRKAETSAAITGMVTSVGPMRWDKTVRNQARDNVVPGDWRL
jgi:hypothetical protein